MSVAAVAPGGLRMPGWRRVLGTMAAVVAVGTAAWQISARTYDPALKNSHYFGYGAAPLRGRAVIHRPGGVFQIRFDITNHGPRAITLTGMSWPRDDPFMHLRSARISERAGSNTGKRLPVEGVALQSGDSRYVWLRVRFDPCPNPRPSRIVGISAPVSVDYRFLGVARSTTLELRGPVRILLPPGCL